MEASVKRQSWMCRETSWLNKVDRTSFSIHIDFVYELANVKSTFPKQQTLSQNQLKHVQKKALETRPRKRNFF